MFQHIIVLIIYNEIPLQAGIPSKNLQLALEPEAASLFCKFIPTEKQTNEDGQNIKLVPFSAGTRYMVLDLGGTVNFAQRLQ